MKVLHIGKFFSPFSGGLENYMRDMMVALARRGIDSAALVHHHSLTLTSSKETFSASGHTFPVVRAGTWVKLLFTPISPGFPWLFKRMIKTFKPDILHLHLPNPSVSWALLLPSARRIPWVVHWHADVITAGQNWPMKLFYQLYRPFERAVLKRAKAVIATSPPYFQSSVPLQPWADKCHVIPLGVDVGRLAGGAATASHDNPGGTALQVLAVGRLTYYKGFRYLIEAAAKAPDTHINLVGHGDQLEKLKALATSLKVQDRVTFHGILSDDQLMQQMTNADCVCLPSIERTEAFGMVLLEAMYFGKATIVSDVSGSGMGWITEHGVTGLQVRPADADALAAAFARLAGNREELAQMGKRGKEKFDREFEINHSMDELMDVYQQILSTPVIIKGSFQTDDK